MNYIFVDTHCHFDFPPFRGHESESLARAAEAGVQKIIIPAVTAEGFAQVLKLASEHTPLFAALGLHPLYIAQHQEAQLEQLAAILASRPKKLVAVGEIGLDLYMETPLFEWQQRVLKAQLELAKNHDLPVILHSRRSHDQLAALLRRASLPRCGVVHGFSGSLAQAQAFIRLGYYIGVGGTISYPRAEKTRNVMAQLPLDKLLLETDAPDMPLAGYQGQANRPERVAEVFQVLCQLRPEPANEIADHLYQNTHALFAGRLGVLHHPQLP